MSGRLFEQPERDEDRILAAIQWPKDAETYGYVVDIVTELGCGVVLSDAPSEVFAEVAQAIRDADGLEPDRRRRYLSQIALRPRHFMARACVLPLQERLGLHGIRRLIDLIHNGGLTPPEARLWLEPPDRDWPAVERLLFEIYDRHCPDEESLPRHLAQWVERYRENYPRRRCSLFD